MRYLFGLALLLSCVSADAQQFVQGKILDSASKEPLPFVNVSVQNHSRGTTTGVDGAFKLNISTADSLYISYVGYESIKIPVISSDLGPIFLKAKLHELKEVEIFAGENPAFPIIRRAIENTQYNDPENLSSFSYKAYHKLFATAEGAFDSAQMKSAVAKFFDQHYLFLNETYSERSFIRGRQDSEVIVANRMSGVNDPFFAALGNQFQSFSFYKTHISVLDQQFVNPLSPGTFSRYDFVLEDTKVNVADTSFIISFAPLHGKTFAGLRGIVTISSNRYGIENVKAQPADDASLVMIRIQQKNVVVQGRWFPQELNSEFVLKEQKVSDHPIKYVHRTYLLHSEINERNDAVERSELNLEFASDANKKDEAFWNTVRVDSLSAREKNTYMLYDSMPMRTLAILNSFVKVAEAVATGKVKAGKFYVPLESLLRKNGYEGVRLGFGIQTGETISKYLVADAYVAVGTKDRALKFGGGLQFKMSKRARTYFKISFSQDVHEPGNSNFLKPPPVVSSSQTFRNWLIAKMDSVTRVKAQFNFHPFRSAESSFFVQRSSHQPVYSYSLQREPDKTISNFTIVETGVQFKFVAGEQISQIRNTQIISGFKYPLFDLSISRSLDRVFDGALNYTKAEVKVDYQYQWRGSSRTFVQLAGGIIKGDAPYFALFNGKGTNTGKFDRNSFVIPNYFQTMKIYEFTSDRYVSFFLSHDFGRIVSTRAKYFRPELALKQNIGFGDLSNPGKHSIALQSMTKGFYESGVTLANLLRINYVNFGYIGLGGGVFFRYGNYALPEKSRNVVSKISVSFAL